MKNIIAIVIIISSLAVFFSKKLELYSSWKKVTARIISIKKLLNNKRITYSYKVNNIEYQGSYIQKINNDIPKNLIVYYHWLNPELSIRNIPLNMEDVLLLIISVIGGLYLYFYSCEVKISPINDSIQIAP